MASVATVIAQGIVVNSTRGSEQDLVYCGLWTQVK